MAIDASEPVIAAISETDHNLLYWVLSLDNHAAEQRFTVNGGVLCDKPKYGDRDLCRRLVHALPF